MLFLFFVSSSFMPVIDKEVEFDAITAAVMKKLNLQLGLSVRAYGGSMPDDIRETTIRFAKTGCYDIPAVRRMLITVAEELLKEINKDKKIRPYLHNFPFTILNLNIDIIFHDSKGNWPSENFVAWVRPIYSRIDYLTHNPKTNTYNEVFYSESYEDALRIVNEEKCRGYLMPVKK